MQGKDSVPTIDQLIRSIRIIKGQRQRANLQRIFKSLKNHHDIHFFKEKAVIDVLEDAVKNGTLTKVYKKDEVAYQEFVQALPKTREGPKKPQLYSAIQEAIVKNNGALTLKAIYDELKNSKLCKDMNSVVFKYTIKICCLRMVTRELLVRQGMLFKLGPYSCLNGEAGIRIQEDEPAIVDKAISNKRPATPTGICGLCNEDKKKIKDEEDEDEEEMEKLISCVECGRSLHPSCLNFSEVITANVLSAPGWQCVDCKRCSKCGKSDQADKMLFCDQCDRGYHMHCCRPPLQQPPDEAWVCPICEEEKNKRNRVVMRMKKKRGFSINNKSSLFKYMKKKHSYQSSLIEVVDQTSEEFKKVLRELVDGCSEEEKELFKHCQADVKEKLLEKHYIDAKAQATSAVNNDVNTIKEDLDDTILENNTTNDKSSNDESRKNDSIHKRNTRIEEIVIGKMKVKTWYSSVYPEPYKSLYTLFICEYCLTYVESFNILCRHKNKCLLRHPPGKEIYRQDGHSVFEVDGNGHKTFAQNICFLAKLFLDHKTLHYDVEPFIFYVLTRNLPTGCQFVGYFSKEKYCQQKYNLSCIMVLPQYQRSGYGGFLIDFSYLLSRKQECTGSPEKPLSELGLFTYQCYWKHTISHLLLSFKDDKRILSIKEISSKTGMDKQDVFDTLNQMNLFKLVDGRLCLRASSSKLQQWASSKKWKADENLLIWKPLVYDAPACNVVSGSPTTNCIDDEGEENDNSNSSADSSNIDCDGGVDDNADLEVGIKGDDDDDEDFFETSTPLVKKAVTGCNEKEEEEEDDDLAKERPSLFDVLTPIKKFPEKEDEDYDNSITICDIGDICDFNPDNNDITNFIEGFEDVNDNVANDFVDDTFNSTFLAGDEDVLG